MKKIILSVGCLVASSCALSAQYFYCNQTNNYIYPGATIESVKQSCGNPISEETKDTVPVSTQKYLEYVYQSSSGEILPKMRSSTMVIDFIDEKVASIKIEGKNVDSTTYCRPYQTISVGDSVADVQAACGLPSAQYVNTHNIKQTPVKETLLTYRPNEYLSAVQLHFFDGKLVSIEP